MATTKQISSLETISGNSAALLGKTPDGNVGYISGILGANGKVTGIPDISGLATTESVNQSVSEINTRLEAVEGKVEFDLTYDAASEKAQTGKAVAQAIDAQRTIKGSTGTSYMSNESSGGILKFITTDQSFGKITLFDASDSEHTYIQIVTCNADKSKEAKINFTLDGAFYSKTAEGAVAIEDNELATKGDLKALQGNGEALTQHIADTTKHLGTVTGPNGTSLLFQEGDGGGLRFTHTDGSGSLIAINDGTDNIYAQVSAHTKDNAKIVRLNVNPDGLYYTKNKADKSVTADDELVTVAVLNAKIAELSAKVTELESKVNAGA